MVRLAVQFTMTLLYDKNDRITMFFQGRIQVLWKGGAYVITDRRRRENGSEGRRPDDLAGGLGGLPQENLDFRDPKMRFPGI